MTQKYRLVLLTKLRFRKAVRDIHLPCKSNEIERETTGWFGADDTWAEYPILNELFV